jgi:hypothetical protein
MGTMISTLITALYFRDTSWRDTNTLQIRPQISHLSHQTERGKLYLEDDGDIQNPMSSEEHTEESMIEDETDQNYLAVSDTDTVECYTVPSPIYPALQDTHEQHRRINYYFQPRERMR